MSCSALKLYISTLVLNTTMLKAEFFILFIGNSFPIFIAIQLDKLSLKSYRSCRTIVAQTKL